MLNNILVLPIPEKLSKKCSYKYKHNSIQTQLGGFFRQDAPANRRPTLIEAKLVWENLNSRELNALRDGFNGIGNWGYVLINTTELSANVFRLTGRDISKYLPFSAVEGDPNSAIKYFKLENKETVWKPVLVDVSTFSCKLLETYHRPEFT